MRTLALILLSLISQSIIAQGYDVFVNPEGVYLNGEAVNRFNKKNQKHGIWVDYDVIGPTLVTMKSQRIRVVQHCHFGDSTYCTREVSREPEEIVRTDTLDDVAYRIRSLGQYKGGKKQGTWFQYFDDGRIRREVLYEKDKIARTFKVYFRSGGLKFVGELEENGQGYILHEYTESGELLQSSPIDAAGLEGTK